VVRGLHKKGGGEWGWCVKGQMGDVNYKVQ